MDLASTSTTDSTAVPAIFVDVGGGRPPALIENARTELLAPSRPSTRLAPTFDDPHATNFEGITEAPKPPALVFPSAVIAGGGAAAKVTPAIVTQATSSASTGMIQRGSEGDEVERLQRLLNRSGARLRIDGDLGPSTDRALRAFQSSHGLTSDGIAGPKTWRALQGASSAPAHATSAPPPISAPPAASAPSPSSAPHPASPNVAPEPARVELVDGGGFGFPLAFRPKLDWHTGARYFGARRDGGKRLHGGCDLIGPVGTQIYAVADGTLVRSPYHFYSGTDALEIRHGDFIIRYGEILPGSYVGGKTVKKGQPICKIGRLSSGSSMLHFEMYGNGASSAPLTVRKGPYRRRADLTDPTKFLDAWSQHLPA